ncbi:ABC transporter ATP-binding protein [Flavobacterium sp. HJ-32-4]|uniref:ABC transporter ATP-binding protein n=1 Tax=Flavobacterium sp. HJ-32-4 TaxID=1160795 RepID=UPI001F144B7F|nr:ABC transporter ATP-binding protein [Flavobacterium sp. HJ-32-4]UMY65183.1 ABC transporter ATP-binding protein/permease [Flavobacterium sp. HJ-32-4]
MRELQYLNKYFFKYKYHFLVGIVTTIVAQIFYSLTPRFVRESFKVVEEYVAQSKKSGNALDLPILKSHLADNILLILGTALIAGILTFLMRQTLIVMSRHIEFDLKNEVFRQYERLDQDFYKRNRTGDLMNRISEDVGKVRMYVGPAVMYTINTLVRFIVVIAFMCSVSPELTLWTVLPLPLLSYVIFKLSTSINRKSTAFQQNLSKLSTFSQELFSGIRVVKAYSLEPKQAENVAQLSEESRARSMDLAKANALFGPLMIALIGVSNLVVIYYGSVMYLDGRITHLGTIAEFILYVNMLTWPVASLGWVTSMVQEAEASQKRINEFLLINPDIQNKASGHDAIAGEIRFENVSFTYADTGIKALENVSFTIGKGETLAILGRTGSGKSTLLSLIGRLYDSTEGQILIDGKPIAEVNLFDLRHSIGFVPQDAFLFSDTIENNIRFGREDATEEEVHEAARMAVVHDNIIGFAQQYQTLLGERGITLSGGQKQRVSIARAFIKDPQILLLDDALSAVDTETEERILHHLADFRKHRTTLIVSHRVSSAKDADRILILDQGRIVQQGTHTALLNEEGYYRELYLKQLSEKEIV